MSKKRYLNSGRKEILLWGNCLGEVLEVRRGYLANREEERWLDSLLISVKALSMEILRGTDTKEQRAVLNASKQVQPNLYLNLATGKRNVPVDQDKIMDLAESAIELCKYDCSGDFETCRRRQLFTDLLIEPWIEDGPCPYYRDHINES